MTDPWRRTEYDGIHLMSDYMRGSETERQCVGTGNHLMPQLNAGMMLSGPWEVEGPFYSATASASQARTIE